MMGTEPAAHGSYIYKQRRVAGLFESLKLRKFAVRVANHIFLSLLPRIAEIKLF